MFIWVHLRRCQRRALITRYCADPWTLDTLSTSRSLVPGVGDSREVSVGIASAVITEPRRLGLSGEDGIAVEDGDISGWLRKHMRQPVYQEYRRVSRM